MSLYLVLFLLCTSVSSSVALSDDKPQHFIVYASKNQKPSVFTSHHHWYKSTLQSLHVPDSSSASSHHRPEIIYTYNHVIHGFATLLTKFQASRLLTRPGILAVTPGMLYQPEITHVPQFLGLNQNNGIWPMSNYGEDVIIGIVDSGIWPERLSFNDSSLSPIPERWKGFCQITPDFPETSCNRKIIGARMYYLGAESAARAKGMQFDDIPSPRDFTGHGTFCASVAAGSHVNNAGFFQYAAGEARGMATNAKIAVYKVCWEIGCYDTDIVAAIDQAVEDGVDVISLSLAKIGEYPPYDQDGLAIAAFGAVAKGVFVSSAAGNEGPSFRTAKNLAPWILTVGASTIDRQYRSDVILGDGRVFRGTSLYSGEPMKQTDEPELSIKSANIAGKVVICKTDWQSGVLIGKEVKSAGAVGLILMNNQNDLEYVNLISSFEIPATEVTSGDGYQILEYQKNALKPTARIELGKTVTGSASPAAPRVAFFSGRGPNDITLEILKPDVTAPGVGILGAWTGASGPQFFDKDDPRRVEYSIMSGTSSACPIASGVAALLRKAYPTWSPAAIRSALMTTAYSLDNAGERITDVATGRESTPFAYGAGHVDPNRALNPGLVYDIGPSDYIAFLCSIGYNQSQISLFTKDIAVDCGLHKLIAGPGDLNYPSFSVVFRSGDETVTYIRTVTNVGQSASATYKAEIKVSSSSSVQITVVPRILVFTEINQKLSYNISFKGRLKKKQETGSNRTKVEFGSIEWYDGVHRVKSPIALTWFTSDTSRNLVPCSPTIWFCFLLFFACCMCGFIY